MCLLYNFTFITVLSQPLFALSSSFQTPLLAGMGWNSNSCSRPPNQSHTRVPPHLLLLLREMTNARITIKSHKGTYFFRTITLRFLSFAAYPLTRPIVSPSTFTHYNAHWLPAQICLHLYCLFA